MPFRASRVFGFHSNFSMPSGAGRVTPAVKAFGNPGHLVGLGIRAVDDRDAVAEHVRRRLDRELRDLDPRLVGDAARLGARLLREVGGDLVAPERDQVRARLGGVGDHDELVGVVAEAHEGRRRARAARDRAGAVLLGGRPLVAGLPGAVVLVGRELRAVPHDLEHAARGDDVDAVALVDGDAVVDRLAGKRHEGFHAQLAVEHHERARCGGGEVAVVGHGEADDARHRLGGLPRQRRRDVDRRDDAHGRRGRGCRRSSSGPWCRRRRSSGSRPCRTGCRRR